MNLVTLEEMKKVLDLVDSYRNIPGGSAANTTRGIAWLSGVRTVLPPVYSGAIGKDAIGQQYWEMLSRSGVESRLVKKDALTGCSVIIVTPDHERTMFTFLGACRKYRAQDLDLQALERSQYLYVCGYMWDTENQKQAVAKAVERARSKSVAVVFDLADPFVVQRYREEFRPWISSGVDILLGNREEIQLMVGKLEEDALSDELLIRLSGEMAMLVVMKIGEDGCWVNAGGSICHVPAYSVQAVDTTGAGDSFASGFLYGLLRGLSPVSAARLANRMAAGSVTVIGCDFNSLDPNWVLEEDQ
ncbi:MAG TPA: adenosine kinase [bacterium]|nr:adenosine kinase [bacterium]